MIGHHGHPEVEGTMGQSAGGMYLVENLEDVARLAVRDESNLAFVTQTTLSVDDARDIVDALKARFPRIVGPKRDDICYATQNRQDAVKTLARQCDVVIVVGSPNSSNSNRLREVARNQGVGGVHGRRRRGAAARMARRRARGRRHRGRVGPEVLVKQVIDRLQSLGADERRGAVRHRREGGVSACRRP